MIKDFKTIELDTQLSMITVENLNDERIKVTTNYKLNDFAPWIETMSIKSEVFAGWYEKNKEKLIIK